MSRGVHIVGSMPLAGAREVFETLSAALGRRITRFPDGETGERGDWITWLEPVFAPKLPSVPESLWFRFRNELLVSELLQATPTARLVNPTTNHSNRRM